MTKKLLIIVILILAFVGITRSTNAQVDFFRLPPTATPSPVIPIATNSAEIASLSAEEQLELEKIKKEDITKPEETQDKESFLVLFGNRPIDDVTLFNFVGYSVQLAVKEGVPANTIILILLLPLLATVMVFIRHIIGLPSLELFVPIAFSITLVSTGVWAGAILLATIILASTVARFVLKRVKIMQLPKMALSIFIVSIFVLISLTASAYLGLLTVTQLSIFPVLILILLAEKIVTLQLTRSSVDIVSITATTLLMGLLGYFILSWTFLRAIILLYPEFIFLLIPINIMMGRYFGLRVTEMFRFSSIK